MKKLTKFIFADLRSIIRDPMLVLTAVAPFIIILVIRIFLQVARKEVLEFFKYDITADYFMIISFFSLMIPMMVGLVIGFIILDERDEQTINYYAVTPLSRSGYLLFRTSVPIIFSFVFSVFFYFSVYDIVQINYLKILTVSLLLSLQAPVFSLLMASFAANKVEGLAIGKLLGLMIFAPIAGYLVSSRWVLLLLIVPQSWVTAIITGRNIPFHNPYLLVALAVAVHASIIFMCVKLFKKRID